MQNDFAIGSRLKNRTFALELVAQDVRINQIPVVRDRHLPAHAVDHEGLRILGRAGAGRGIARMPDRPGPFQFFEVVRAKNLGDQAHVLMHVKRRPRAVAGDNAGALLAAVLQGEKPVVGQDGGVGMTENTEKPAFVLGKDCFRRQFFGIDNFVWRGHTK